MRRLKIRYFTEWGIIDKIINEVRKTVFIKIINKIIR